MLNTSVMSVSSYGSHVALVAVVGFAQDVTGMINGKGPCKDEQEGPRKCQRKEIPPAR